MEVLLSIVVFGLAMTGMAVGVILSDRSLRGSCGGDEHTGPDGELLSCGACPKQQADMCPSDDVLISIAQVGHPNPRHHR